MVRTVIVTRACAALPRNGKPTLREPSTPVKLHDHLHPASNSSSTKLRWPQKSDLYILRSDGFSCQRETVTSEGSLEFEHPSSQQHLLVWKSRPKCVMVLKKLGHELEREYAEVVRYLGVEQGMTVLVEPAEYEALLDREPGAAGPWMDTWGEEDVPNLHRVVDFVVCLGGDGLTLHAAHLFGQSMPPIISFRLGSLGFLTAHDFANHKMHLENVINGFEEIDSCRVVSSIDGSALVGVYITLRMRLQCQIFRSGCSIESPGARYDVLNEVVLSRGAYPYLSKIEVYERDALITKVQADGVMLATPTGSTAYSVAAGGSMVHPNVPAILFTPICPHTLSFRPVILPDYAKLELKIAGDARSAALATFDGKHPTELWPGDSIRVQMSPHPVPTINLRDQTLDWFSSIERCFHWNDRTEQKEFSPHHQSQPYQPSPPTTNRSAISARLLSTGEIAPGSTSLGTEGGRI